MGPSESSLLSPFGYDMLAVPLCLFITQKSYTPKKAYRCRLASGATWELPAREMDGPQGLFSPEDCGPRCGHKLTSMSTVDFSVAVH